MYELTADDAQNTFLEVWCGGIALNQRVIRLTQEELAEYAEAGKSVLDTLALKVCRKPGFFEEREAQDADGPSL